MSTFLLTFTRSLAGGGFELKALNFSMVATNVGFQYFLLAYQFFTRLGTISWTSVTTIKILLTTFLTFHDFRILITSHFLRMISWTA